MIAAIARKELTEFSRDGRVLALLGLLVILVLAALLTGWATQAERQRQTEYSQRHDQETFIKQGRKPTHSAAHFGRMAYKPVPALATFDPGAAPYQGQVIWLEAHRRNPAMFRPAEDAPELRRLADLSVAGILTLLLPLLIFLLGHGALVGERERGTLGHILASGPTRYHLFVGKLCAIAAVATGISVITIATSTALALPGDFDGSAGDTIARGASLIAVYVAYGIMLCAVAVAVSARTRSSSSALLILLSIWALSTVVVPRVAANVADRVHPIADSAAFWKQTIDAMRSAKPRRDSDEYRAIERAVLSRAFGRDIRADEIATLQVNRRGLNLEVAELLGAKTYQAAYDDLHATYGKQRQVRRWFAVFAPAIALQHLSSALAGTNIDAHEHFSQAAEQQRRLIISMMNDDLLIRGAHSGDAHLSSHELWERIPNFAYRAPGLPFAIQTATWDALALLLWSVAALWLARHGVEHQRIF